MTEHENLVERNNSHSKTTYKQPMHWLSQIFYLDLRSLAIFRITTGFWMLLNLLDRSQDLTLHYTENGFHPVSAIALTHPMALWSLHWLNDSYQFELTLFIVHAICALCFLLGFRTRLFTFLTWLFLVSLHNRNELILHGGDKVLRVLLFWCLFLPLGEYFSLDRLRGRAQTKGEYRIFSAASIGFILQLLSVYWFVILSRHDSSWWSKGNAVSIVLNTDFLVRDLARPLLDWPVLLKVLTWATIIIELFAPFLILIPNRNGRLRKGAIIIFVTFHASIAILLRLPYFSTMMIFSWLSLWPVHGHGGGRGTPMPRTPTTVVATLTLVYFIFYQILLVIFHYDPLLVNPHYARWFAYPARIVRIDQGWNLFAPGPLKEDFRLVVIGTLRDGTQVDLMQSHPIANNTSPSWPPLTYRNEIWTKLAINLFKNRHPHSLNLMGLALAREWNSREAANNQVKDVQVIFAREPRGECSRCELREIEVVSTSVLPGGGI